MNIAPCLSVIGVFVYLGAFAVYNIDLLRGQAYPAPSRATWTMWAILIVLMATSYSAMSHDWWKSLQLYGGIAANILTCFFVWTHGGTKDFNRQNWVIIFFAFLAISVWWVTRDATWGNLILLLAVGLSSIPLVKNVAQNPKTEKPLPWMMFALSYSLQLVVVLMRYTQIQDLGAPVGGTILHLLVGLLALRQHSSEPLPRT